MLIEVFRYPDAGERGANTGQLGRNVPREPIGPLHHQNGHRDGQGRYTSRGGRFRALSVRGAALVQYCAG
ncbi:hypothetical protein GCM10010449_44680 [Streptomyces rectiviolaceus]|uniref:Uncharacterized protein n=1 Tax=Streptomyces rectiviolaceus TaxID=332591 RepID=A0ABP6MKG3_9ACTN